MNESDDSGAPAIPRLMLTADEVATALGIGRTRVFDTYGYWRTEERQDRQIASGYPPRLRRVHRPVAGALIAAGVVPLPVTAMLRTWVATVANLQSLMGQ